MLIKNFSLRHLSHAVAKARPSGGDLKTQAEALATRLEPALARAVLRLLKAQNDAVTLQVLVDALKAGDVGKVVSLIEAAGEALTATAGPIQTALQDAIWAAGAMAAASMKGPNITQAEFHFDRLNPKLVSWTQGYTLDLIRQINTSTRESIREVLVSQMLAGQSPLDAARKIKGVIGLTDYQSKAVLNFRAQLEGFHQKKGAGSWGLGKKTDKVHGLQVMKPDLDGLPKDGVLTRRLRDFRYDKMLAGAMKTGKPLTAVQIEKMTDRYAQKWLAFRARTIARTESMRTVNVGIQDAFRQAVDQGLLDKTLVRRFWVVAHDERLCKVCAPVPEMNPNGVAFDQPFATPQGLVFLAPMHPNCRCSVFIQTVESGPPA